MQSVRSHQDPEGAILENIMTAVGPVGSRESGSNITSRVSTTRATAAGAKVPHNISGLVGVMDGAGSDLRTGLPFQMIWVHNRCA